MNQSNTLITAHIHFIDDRVSLIHLPLKDYKSYVQPLLQLLNPATITGTNDTNGSVSYGSFDGSSQSGMPWANQHSFLNISITPIECSVVCSKTLAEECFAPIITQGKKNQGTRGAGATISSEEYIVISVEGEGLEAGQRVFELTSPLAMAGISIFFITTYFSDYILVPSKSRGQVIRALEERGFAFEKSAEAYVNVAAHHRKNSSTSFEWNPPSTPPPTTISELQMRTFSLLRRGNIIPQVHRDLRLIQCAGRRESPTNHSAQDLELQIGLTKCIIHPPRFFSLTLTESEPASLLLERSTLQHFGSEDVLLGSKGEFLIPITFNLESLTFEPTGIVCGVAGRLVGGTNGQLLDRVEMSYLSTARAGTLMVDEKDLERAVEALNTSDFGLGVV